MGTKVTVRGQSDERTDRHGDVNKRIC